MPPLELVSRISHDMTLLAGDVISCGTSLGVGSIKDGAGVEITIDGIGSLMNVLAPSDGAAARSDRRRRRLVLRRGLGFQGLENPLHAGHAGNICAGFVVSAPLAVRQVQSAPHVGIAGARTAQMDDRGQFLFCAPGSRRARGGIPARLPRCDRGTPT